MRIPTLSGSLLLLAAAPTLHAQYFEARNSAMGGTGVASSHYLIAGVANPALLTRHGESDDFGIRLPTAGVQAYDESSLIQDLSDFVDAYEELTATSSAEDFNRIADQLEALDDRLVYGNFGVGFAFAAPSKKLGWSIHLNTYADLVALTDIDEQDIDALRAQTLPESLNSEARIAGAAVTELGLSLATRFEVGEKSGLSLGLTPKFQRIDTFNYIVEVDNFAEGDFAEGEYREEDYGFNLDAGIAFEPGSGFTLGAFARNLIEYEYDSAAIPDLVTPGAPDRQFTYVVGPSVTAGVAWTHGILTLASDLDLLVQERFQANGFDDEVQFASVGAELDLWKWFQLRGGYRKDLEEFVDDAITGGIGLSPFDVFHVDVAGIYVDDNSYGAVVQLSFTF